MRVSASSLAVFLLSLRAALPWRVGPPAVPRRAIITMMSGREPPKVVQRASNLLGGLLADAVKRMQADPGKPIPMKQFTFTASTRNIRIVQGDTLPDYMLEPVEKYIKN